MNYRFKCPACGHTHFEECMVAVTVTTKFSEVSIYSETSTDDASIEIHYGDQTNDGGEVVRYQCASCGEELTNDDPTGHIPVDTDESLLEWMKCYGIPVRMFAIGQQGFVTLNCFKSGPFDELEPAKMITGESGDVICEITAGPAKVMFYWIGNEWVKEPIQKL